MKTITTLLAIAAFALSLSACQTTSKKECCAATGKSCPAGSK